MRYASMNGLDVYVYLTKMPKPILQVYATLH